MPKVIQERTMFKILVERTGGLFSITTRHRAYFFFLSAHFIGARVAPTTDPYPGIVEFCDYDISNIVRNWGMLANVKFTRATKPQRDTGELLTSRASGETERSSRLPPPNKVARDPDGADVR